MRNLLQKPVRASVIAAELGLAFEGDDVEVATVAPISAPRAHALSFATHPIPDELPANVCVIAPGPLALGTRTACLRSLRPRLDFVKALLILDRLGTFERWTRPPEIHPSAVVGPNVSFGNGVVVGAGTRIGANVTIASNTRIGNDCWLKANCVIGEAGFGFERDTDGKPLRMLHFGGVILEDRVEVGSSTTVCQGTLAPTVIEQDSKIDDHVHVAHNVHIKKNALVTACAELSGGVVIGEAAWVGPNASVLEKVHVGDRAFIGIGAVVLRDVAPDTTVVGNPARVLERKRLAGGA